MVSGFLGTGNPGTENLVRVPGSRVLAFLGTGNPLGFLAPDVPKPGFLKLGTRPEFQVPMNPEPTIDFAFRGSCEREPEPDTPDVTETAIIAMVLVLWFLMFQCSVTLLNNKKCSVFASTPHIPGLYISYALYPIQCHR
jgi:hypothetical protein